MEPADPPQAHELVARGWACYSIEDLTGARRHWDAAFKAFRAADDAKGQAGVATNLGRLHHSLGNEAASRGWLARAGRLLERVGLATFERLGAERDADRTAAFLRRLGQLACRAATAS